MILLLPPAAGACTGWQQSTSRWVLPWEGGPDVGSRSQVAGFSRPLGAYASGVGAQCVSSHSAACGAGCTQCESSPAQAVISDTAG